ncbi:hypothetical protein A3B42_04665 [Candidatus Daviesbacteria bacterium RIFCSPLOWO2_01_FULL_38_10]|nr:MAG: hypothetical protein US80_C0018G0003 [Candidatus Daviesbacteria bacterium GW2011_GWA2_38_17]OGE25914.1 MAG: hypothetical protein A3D02_02655 [Candidatus Daviesbacteria bacterium RIFCSPHIGHO2_02_FULL_39_41]OGE28764.1 MAG: hypothetical protein A2772_00425 [Candidatus Daviesbacteria bacterium RIFCSPHIGHO2_01_FULL_38_8b]OGE38132.1 MAG: hypothetical protein A3B42_04665 [Candidatus Daviesbacteria bacterium RIFCSPLOWO2_01_FULL_38_10]OGE45254.1 MAG: hypothetical protein A3E67_01880 [Candidatus 
MKLKKLFNIRLPLWLVLVLVIDAAALAGLGEYVWWKNQTLPDPAVKVANIKLQVLPQKGYTTSLKWQELGKKLVEAGAIDPEKFQFNPQSQDYIKIDEQNSKEIVNFFWALGLTQKSKVLDEGPMKKGETPLGNFASTGGWTLGKKDAVELYSSTELFSLNDFQQNLVKKISDGVFRPCCGNATSFPDCNHGMAALGYIEWAVYNGLSEEQIFKDLLAFNTFWFPQNYLEMAMYFDKQGMDWKKVDPKLALSRDYSSAQGAARIKQEVQSVPGLQIPAGSCGA